MKYAIEMSFLFFLLSGCGSVPKINNDFSEGNFSEIVRDSEHSGVELSKMPLSTLYFLCPSYYEVRDYSDFKRCADIILNHPNPQTEFYPGVDATLVDKNEFQGYMLSYKARMMLEFGNYKNALETAEEAYKKVQKGANNIRKDFNKIPPLEVKALALIHLGRKSEARLIIPKLESISSYMPVNSSILSIIRQTAVAKIYFALHDYKNARRVLEDQAFDPLYSVFTSLVIFVDNVSSDKNIREAAIRVPRLYMLSKSYMETGDIEKAKKGFDALLSTPVINSMGSIYWLTLRDSAKLSWNSGQKNRAISLLEKAVEVIESQRSTIQTEAYKIGFVGDKQKVYQLLVNYLIKSKRVSDAFAYAEKAKARALVDMLAQKQSFKGGKNAATENDIKQLTELEQKYQLQTMDAIKGAVKTRGLIRRKQKQLVELNPQVSSLVSASEIKSSAIQNFLEPDEQLVEYYGNANDLYVFVVSRDRIKVVDIPVNRLASKVRRFRNALLETHDSAWKKPSEDIYNLIIKPIQNALNKKKLVFVPHGPLHYLPFAALYDGHQFLIDRYNLSVLPSASVMAFLTPKTVPEQIPLLALGNPDLHDAELDLPGAQNEVREIGKIIKGAKVLTKNQATETIFKQFAGKTSILHIASHGEFDPKHPLESRLLLASDAKNDGSLKVDELYDMDINSELVTLSACQTGLGDVESGDDVIGLTRGFLFAGAKNIVASLWVVDDKATSQLMKYFYQNLSTLDVEESLRKAQLSIKNNLNSHPYYWASFQLIGLGSTRVNN
jgi:CHAT domain-containing protein